MLVQYDKSAVSSVSIWKDRLPGEVALDTISLHNLSRLDVLLSS